MTNEFMFPPADRQAEQFAEVIDQAQREIARAFHVPLPMLLGQPAAAMMERIGDIACWGQHFEDMARELAERVSNSVAPRKSKGFRRHVRRIKQSRRP